MQDWVKEYRKEFGAVYMILNSNKTGSFYPEERRHPPIELGESQFDHVIELREEALKYARIKDLDFLFVSTF